MDDIAKGWLILTAAKNAWRVNGILDKAELIQEGYLCYYSIAARYPNATEPRHLMALFQTAFTRRLHKLAKQRTRRADVIHLADDLDFDLTLVPEADEDGPDIDDAPCHLRELVAAYARRPNRIYLKPRRGKDGTRELTSEWLSRVVGYPVPVDAHHELLAYIKGRSGFGQTVEA